MSKVEAKASRQMSKSATLSVGTTDRAKLVPEHWRHAVTASPTPESTVAQRRARALCNIWVLSRTSTQFCENFLPFLRGLDAKLAKKSTTPIEESKSVPLLASTNGAPPDRAKSAPPLGQVDAHPDPASRPEYHGAAFGEKPVFGPGFGVYGTSPSVPAHTASRPTLADSEIDGYIAKFVRELIRQELNALDAIETFLAQFPLSPVLRSPAVHVYEGNGLFYEAMLYQQITWKSIRHALATAANGSAQRELVIDELRELQKSAADTLERARELTADLK